MIAFDLDGVLCPEYTYIESETQDSILQKTLLLRAIFQPKDLYYIITGRNNVSVTEQWIAKYLKVAPTKLFVNTDKLDPAEFKTNVINTHPEITKFIESELAQADYIKKHTKISVYHIDRLIE